MLLLLAAALLCLNGCAILQVGGQLVGGLFSLLGNIVGGAVTIAKKVPWWLWI